MLGPTDQGHFLKYPTKLKPRNSSKTRSRSRRPTTARDRSIPAHMPTLESTRPQAVMGEVDHGPSRTKGWMVSNSASMAGAGQRVSKAAEELVRKLRQAYPDADIRQNISPGLFSLDALVVLKKTDRLLAFQIKITRPKNVRNRLVEAAVALSSAVATLSGDLPSHWADPVLVLL